jgi:predicted glycoside hydrolase/deacetylase ChbG (UPF0249 family)
MSNDPLPSSKRIAFCADDYGAGPRVDRGILALVRRGRLGAVSCQAACPGWPGAARALLAAGAPADLGLHLDLASGRGGLAALLARSHLRALPRRDLAARIAGQLDAFEREAGRPPDFVDGHQHCHQLPVVRDVLLDLLEARYPARLPFVRSTRPRRWRGTKSWLLARLGGAALAEALAGRKFPHNADFGGVYDLRPGGDHRARMRAWLADVGDGGLVMCHPGEAPGDPGDPIGPARARELAYLDSDAFPADLADAHVEPVRLRALAGLGG